MPYMIDGHNLIASLPQIDLRDPDDEARLVDLLVAFCSRVHKQVTVYFDRAGHGMQDPALMGGVTIRFVKSPSTADQAIASHLRQLGGEARNWTVVSSDRDVRRSARSVGARLLSTREFSRLLQPTSPQVETSEKPSAPGSREEIADWEEFFQRRNEI